MTIVTYFTNNVKCTQVLQFLRNIREWYIVVVHVLCVHCMFAAWSVMCFEIYQCYMQ